MESEKGFYFKKYCKFDKIHKNKYDPDLKKRENGPKRQSDMSMVEVTGNNLLWKLMGQNSGLCEGFLLL